MATVLCSSFVESAVDFQQVRRLRRQGLYRAAERKCLDLLDTKLTATDRAMTLVEYLRTIESHISTTDANGRVNLITQATQKVDVYNRKAKEGPYKILVAIQFAITKSANARLARYDAEANITTDEFESAIRSSRGVIREFEAIREKIGSAMGEANRRSPQDGFSQVQFQRLRHTVDLETAHAWMNLAQCFPNSKKDQISVLGQALNLTEPLSRLTTNPTIATKARLLDAECRRRTGDSGRARQILATMAADTSLSPCLRLAVATQQIWLHIDIQQYPFAQQVVDRAKSLQCNEAQRRAEYNYATLNLYVERAIQTGESDNVWRLRSDQLADSIAREFPGYWHRRSEIVHANLRGGSAIASELAKLEAQAKRAFAMESFDEAVNLFRQAAATAEKKDLRDRVFEFRYRAGAIRHQQGRFREAITLLRQAACDDASMPDASKAHLLAVVDAAQMIRSGSADGVARYEELLQEHLEKWPNSNATTNQAAWWLGQLRQRQSRIAEALNVYEKIDLEFSEYRQVIDAIRTCHTVLIENIKDARQIPDAIQLGVNQLETIAARAGSDGDLGRWAKLSAIDLQLLRASKTASGEQQLLKIIDAAQQAKDESAVTKGTALLVITYVTQGRMSNADRLLPRLKVLKLQGLHSLMRRLDGIDHEKVQRELAQLQLKLFALKYSETGGDNGEVPDDIRSLYAKSLTTVGRFDESINVLQQQLERRPLSIPLRTELASTLQQAERPAEALHQWRKIAASVRPSTDEWFKAKYGIAGNLLASGKANEAADVIRVTQALHPSLGGSEWKRRFVSLLRECEDK